MVQRKPHKRVLVRLPHQPSPSAWQDPIVAIIMERLGRDNPLLGRVSMDIAHLKALGVEVTPTIANNVIDRFETAERRHREIVLPREAKPYEPPKPRAKRGRWTGATQDITCSVVYYMRIGNRVKIGTSTNLEERLSTINPEELMVVEPGTSEIERVRHQQFANLRTHGEWFRLEGRLVEHIDALREQAQRTMDG